MISVLRLRKNCISLRRAVSSGWIVASKWNTIKWNTTGVYFAVAQNDWKLFIRFCYLPFLLRAADFFPCTFVLPCTWFSLGDAGSLSRRKLFCVSPDLLYSRRMLSSDATQNTAFYRRSDERAAITCFWRSNDAGDVLNVTPPGGERAELSERFQ